MLVDAAITLSEAAYFSPEEDLVHRLGSRLTGSPSVATWGSFAARALPLIALPGLVFRSLPDEQAALWFVLITVQGMQLLLESNVGLTFIRAIGFALGGATHLGDQRHSVRPKLSVGPNEALLAEVWATMRYVYLWVAALTLAFASVAVVASTPTLVAAMDRPFDGCVAAAIFCAGAALRAYGGLHISYLYGIGQIVLLRWWEMFFWLLGFGAAALALWSEAGLIAVATAYQLPLIANLALNAFLTRREQVARTGFQFVPRRSRQVLQQLWPAMWRSGLGVGIYLGVTQGAGLFYARIGQPAEVAVYLFAMSLMRPMIQFAQVPFFTKLPMLAALQASGDRAAFVSVAQRGMRLSHVALAATICGAAALMPVIEAIGGASARVPLLLWSSIGLAAFLERMGGMHLQLYSQTNHILWHWANGGTAIVFVAAAMILHPAMGAVAFPLSLAAACLLFYVPYCMIFSYRAFSLDWSFELKNSVLPLCLVLGLQIISLRFH